MDLLGNIRNTPLISASSRLDIDNELNRNDETRKDVDLEDADFPALKPNSDRGEHARHMVKGHNTPDISVPKYLKGRIQTQNKPLPHQFTQPQNMTTLFSPHNALSMVEQTPQKQILDSDKPINKLAEAIAGIDSQQRHQTSSAYFKPISTNTLIFTALTLCSSQR